MKKVILLSTLALCGTASAQNIQQYVSAKGSLVYMQNDLSGSAAYQNKVRYSNNLDKNESDTLGGLRLAYGIVLPVEKHHIRAEIEYGYNGDSKLDNDIFYMIAAKKTQGIQGYIGEDVGFTNKVKSQFVMTNVYYDFVNDTDFTPYFSAGIGYAKLKSENGISVRGVTEKFSESSNNFAWSLGAGVSYDITDNFVLDAGYRYIDYGKVKSSKEFSIPGQTFNHVGNMSAKMTSNELNVGLRYTF